MLQHSFALEVQHGVDDVLQGLGAGDPTAFGHVADRENGGLRFFRETHQPRGALSHLSHVSRRTLEIAGEYRLDGIDDYRVETLRAGSGKNCLEQSLIEEGNIFCRPVKPFGTELHLKGGLFTGHVQRRVTHLLELSRDLEKERRLSNPRLAANEDHRARHDSAAEYKIEFLDSCLEPPAQRTLDVPQPYSRCDAPTLGHRLLPRDASTRRSGRFPGRHLLDQRIPLAARIAAASPLGMVRATVSAAVNRFCFRTHCGDRRGERFSKRVYVLLKYRLTNPVGPLRCLPTMVSGRPSSEFPSLCSVPGCSYLS